MQRAVLLHRLFLIRPHSSAINCRITTAFSRSFTSAHPCWREADNQIDKAIIGEQKKIAAKTPWHREGADMPPVKRERSATAMTKGKLLTTPSRLLKLILPLTTSDQNSDRKDMQPLALLVHPHQPLSYLERLIQSELPLIKDKEGKEKVPSVHFRADDSADDGKEIKAEKRNAQEPGEEEEGEDEEMVNGELTKTGKITTKKSSDDEEKKKTPVTGPLRGGPGEGGVERYLGSGHERTSSTKNPKFVRWSSSTDIGDFIRDAARGKEFIVDIESSAHEIRVGVPSFSDRSHYLRMRLRKCAQKLETMASVKEECDKIAHLGAQRLALGGFGILVSWWVGTYYFTFQTDYGWDTMEPITYLAGLSTIMSGYLWFLYHNREVSYRSALNLTVSRRQNTLYQAKGFNPQQWESLVEEANALRKEIKQIADEYDVEWNERWDEGSEVVHKALKKDRDRKKRREDNDEDGEDGDEGGSGDEGGGDKADGGKADDGGRKGD